MYGLELPELNYVDVVEKVVELMAEDGTFLESSSDSESSARNSGRALETIGLALSFMDESTKNSVRDLVAGVAAAVNTLLSTAKDAWRGADALFLGSTSDGLEITSTVLEGTARLMGVLSDTIDVTPSTIHRFGNFFISRKAVTDLSGAFHLLSGARTLMHHPSGPPLTVIATPTMSDSSTKKYVVSVRNLFGKSAGNCQVNATVKSTIDNRIMLKSEPMLATVGQPTSHELDLLQHGPVPGAYSVLIDVQCQAGTGRARVKRALTISTQISRSEFVLSTASRPTGAASSSQTTSFPDPFADKVVVPQSTPFMRLSITLTSNSGPISPHQVMVRFTHIKGGESSYVVLEPESEAAGQHSAVVDCRDKQMWLSGSGDHRASVIIGDRLLHNSVVWDLGVMSLRLPSTASRKAVKLYQRSLSHESDTATQALPEIIHQVKKPAARPPEATSLLFTLLVTLPLITFVVHTAFTYSKRAPSPAGVWAFLFQVCIGTMFTIYFLFWYSLDLFTALKYLAPCSVVTVCVGSRAMQKLTRS